MVLLTLYKGLLESMQLTANKDGLVSVTYADGQSDPVMIDGKRLALPTPALLRAGEWDGLIAFHPLSENVLRGESIVLKKLKAYCNTRLTAVLSELIGQLVELGANPKRHPKVAPRAAAVLSLLKDVDERSVAAFHKVLEHVVPDGTGPRLISVFFKRGGELDGNKYSRLALVTFPILKEFENEDSTVFGVKLRKKDFQAFKALFEYLLPDAEDPTTYSYGSHSMVAPYFDALIHAYAKVAEQLNAVVTLQRKQLENPDWLITDLSWYEAAEDLSKFVDLIPSLPGNEGELDQSKQASTHAASVNTGQSQKVIGRTAAPVGKVATTAAAAGPSEVKAETKSTSDGIDFNSLMMARQQATYVPTTMPAQPAGVYGQPTAMFSGQPVGYYAQNLPAAPMGGGFASGFGGFNTGSMGGGTFGSGGFSHL